MAKTHAVVVGGSMAGLCVGRVLTDFFDHVTILDRDTYPDGAMERAGVPQSRHVHALLARGRMELENLFPGFDRLMKERGAHEVDFGTDFAALREQGWQPRQVTGIPLWFASRNLIEAITRELCRKHPNVELAERTEAAGLLASRGDHTRVTGIKVRSRDGGGSSEMASDLVVDASGRSSKFPQWLGELGVEPPRETVVDSFSGYSSRWFKAPAPERRPSDWWWKGIWLDPQPPEHMTAGVLFPVEQNRWIVTIAGISKNYPPSDEEGFTAALSQLRSPIIAEVVRLGEPISPVYSNRAMANRWRHYEQWKTRVDGFVAVGDSACAFNPVYGQGMSSGAMSAIILRDTLKESGAANPNLPRRFFKAQANFQRGPWGLATGADFRFEGTEGVRPWSSRIVSPLLNAVFASAADDAFVRNRMGEVINLLKPPSALFDPQMLRHLAVATIRKIVKRPEVSTAPIPSMPPALAIESPQI
jgi:2-polyprenyl-6-methoxyphenol hydroxylase-like FAD-dependent oxidoreductase